MILVTAAVGSPPAIAYGAAMERRPIALLCAMAGEAKPVIDALGLLPVAPPAVVVGLPFRYWSGRRGNTPVVAAVSGTDPRFGVDNIGLEPAALAAFAAIRGFTPTLIINAGTAGSFAARGANVGAERTTMNAAATTGTNGTTTVTFKLKRNAPKGIYQALAVANDNGVSGSGATNFTVQ